MLPSTTPLHRFIKTNLVSPGGRHSFWRFYFGSVPDWQRIEGDVFALMDSFCEVYQGAFWEFSMLSNDGAFIWPEMLETSLRLFNPHNGHEAELSPEAAGIVVCLITYSRWSFKRGAQTMADYFHQLRDYAQEHPEQAAIFHLID